ncbi:MAG: response regulator transcription factor [Thermoleophilia bacterium]|nr:response regulator transcription factor [Thermoleophilia bacterium]
MVERTTRLIIVDDHAVVRRGLRSVLESCRDFSVVGEAANGEEALRLAAKLRPDIVLLDLNLPGRNGLEVIPELLTGADDRPAVLVLTVHADDDIVLKAVTAGASGYVLKHASAEELVQAIRRVAAGGHYFDDIVMKTLLRQTRQEKEPQLLTEHELRVLQLVAEGLTNKEIAQELFLSADTVKSHLETIFRKLGVSHRAHAVAVAMRTGMLK